MTAQSMSFFELLGQAGWAMAPLYVCSVVGLAVVIRKLLEFRTAGVHRNDAMDAIADALKAGDLERIEQAASKTGGPLGRVLATAAAAVADHPLRAEDEVGRVAGLEIQNLERYLGLIAFVAQVSPLFGLLGTVLGMVDLFSGMEAAGQTVDASTLSAGIWKALLTTAAGLVIAIPLLGAHTFLTGQTDRLKLRMSDGGSRILTRALGKRPESGRLKPLGDAG
jgi:biopolymer transport protein ExbB